jgi:hypothetical protein
MHCFKFKFMKLVGCHFRLFCKEEESIKQHFQMEKEGAQEGLILYQYGPYKRLPSFDPFCLQIQVF